MLAYSVRRVIVGEKQREKDYGNRTIPQAIVDDWIIQHNDIVTIDLCYHLYGRLNSRLLKSRYNDRLKDLEGSKKEKE